MSDAPERIWLTPEDAAAFGRKYGHPGVTMVCVGDPSVSYFHEDHVDAIVAEKVREALTEAARIGYVACAETRHVTLGMSVEQRILALRDQKEPKG